MSETKQSPWVILGINGDQDFCDVCGKVELSKVVWLENTETGEIKAAGTTCAARMLGRRNPTAPSTKSKIEGEALEAMKSAINAECQRILEGNTRAFNGYLCLFDCIQPIARGEMTFPAMLALRAYRFPILMTIRNGFEEITVEQAFTLIQK
jgi:hypothetical protein